MRKKYVLYPLYFDSKIGRRKGRRVPLDLAVKKPKAEEIARAAEKLGFKARVEDKHHPSRWFYRERRVIVESSGVSKTQLIRMIASKLRRFK